VQTAQPLRKRHTAPTTGGMPPRRPHPASAAAVTHATTPDRVTRGPRAPVSVGPACQPGAYGPPLGGRGL